jgi:hypothetical protein
MPSSENDSERLSSAKTLELQLAHAGHRLETILVVQSAEDWHRDDAMTITNPIADGA